jgi:hypothetical protein
MPDQTFYVGAQDKNDRAKVTGYVPARFLIRRGRYVMDPMPGGSQGAFLYSDASGSNKTNGKIANPFNYLIVPNIHSEQKARNFAAGIAGTWGNTLGDETGGAMGLSQALMDMRTAFRQGGSQDLQRNPQWGIPKDSFVPAFIGSASDHLGYVTAISGLPAVLAEIAGGFVNKLNAANRKPPDPPIDTEGPHGLSWHNYHNITQGFSDGLAASQPPTPFNDYGYPAQPKPAAGQIGDGNGISPFSAALAGINPDEPAPPEWPPQTNAPVRYLSPGLASQWTQGAAPAAPPIQRDAAQPVSPRPLDDQLRDLHNDPAWLLQLWR